MRAGLYHHNNKGADRSAPHRTAAPPCRLRSAPAAWHKSSAQPMPQDSRTHRCAPARKFYSPGGDGRHTRRRVHRTSYCFLKILLAGLPAAMRQAMVVSTKVTPGAIHYPVETDGLDYENVVKSLRTSLQELGRPSVDIFYLHSVPTTVRPAPCHPDHLPSRHYPHRLNPQCPTTASAGARGGGGHESAAAMQCSLSRRPPGAVPCTLWSHGHV